MGDRWDLDKSCIHCGTENKSVWYSPTSNSYTFNCKSCKKTNFIKSNFEVIKVEDVTLDDIKDAFLMATNVVWTDEEVERMCKQTLKELRAKS